MRILTLCVMALCLMTATTAMADTIASRFGFSGRVGFVMPEKVAGEEFVNGTSDTKSGLAWNAGFIYGHNDNLASELEVSYLPSLDVHAARSKAYEAKLTDIAIGLQYRFSPQNQLVPYVGAGVDFMKGSLQHINGNDYDLDWTCGGHIKTGLDWFLTRGIALTADLRATIAASGDVSRGGTKVSEYDPFWVQGVFGIRLILPDNW